MNDNRPSNPHAEWLRKFTTAIDPTLTALERERLMHCASLIDRGADETADNVHIRKRGESDKGHRVDFAFTGDVDAGSVIQMTLNGIEVAMPMRAWHALAIRSEETNAP